MPSESQSYNEQLAALRQQEIPVTDPRRTRSQRRKDSSVSGLARIENQAVSRVNGGLGSIDIAGLPNVDSYFPSDYHIKSSVIPETDLSEADETLRAIKQQRATAKIVKENVGLASDISKIKSDVAKLIGSEIGVATNLEKINASVANLNSAQQSTQIAETNLNTKRFERESTETLSGLIAQKLIAQQNEARAKTAQIEARTAHTMESSNFNTNTIDI